MYEVVVKLIILGLGETDQQGVTGRYLSLSNPTAVSERLIALAGYRKLEDEIMVSSYHCGYLFTSDDLRSNYKLGSNLV